MNLETIGYILYSGLGMLILAFLFLLASLVNKTKQTENSFYGEDTSDYEYEEEVYPVRERKSYFPFGKNKKDNHITHETEEYPEHINYEEDSDDELYSNYDLKSEFTPNRPDEYNYEDDGVEDEYESDFAFIESVSKKARSEQSDFEFDFDKYTKNKIEEIDTEEDILLDDDFSTDKIQKEEIKNSNKKKGLTIKHYEEENENDADIEAEMMQRINAYKERFKK
ncbi:MULTISPECIES: hypothetical protein [Bacillus cereus group]|uniref:Uncharacterized protein n=2 Tax=Bacillus cereus group TaxID=86661 RepID=A0A9X6WJ33_BACTU|nr:MULTISPECIES: hypothetical protein [Bacillus cereus group]PFJ31066.1 hypothetical protein COJ15_30505 [Bacillus thuringiensis]PGP11534.1 hypothetical protein COA01_35310 [Bacillus cereus]